jgi:hypothetical protein
MEALLLLLAAFIYAALLAIARELNQIWCELKKKQNKRDNE